MNRLIHGGDLDAIENLYNIKKTSIIDFSSNINPLGVPENIKHIIINNLEIIKNYPDKDYLNLRESISEYTNCKASEIIVGNGATEIISIFIKVFKAKNSIIVSPSYSEYERELKNNGCNISFFELKESEDFNLNIENLIKSSKGNDLIVLCNPNNPTGSAVNLKDLEKLASHCQKENIMLMIDETYAEFTNFKDNISALPLVSKYSSIFIVRGSSKFFCTAGARLGYGISSSKEILDKIIEKKDPWSVNSFANLIGIHIFKDKNFIKKTENLIFSERENFFNALSEFKNLKFYPSKSNFILCKILNELTSDFVFEELIKDKILIRDASNFPFLGNKFFRFCILSKNDNKLLLKKLKNILR